MPGRHGCRGVVSDFADLADAGRHLQELLAERGLTDATLVAIVPNGVPVAEPVAEALGLPLVGATVLRDGEPRAGSLPAIPPGTTAVVIDDGVETGTAALVVGLALRERDCGRLLLAVPVCPREAEPRLRGVYDEIIAVERPLVRRDLHWHYRDFDTVSEEEALGRLRER